MRTRLMVLPILALAAACASAPSGDLPQVPLPDGTYRVSGIMGAKSLDARVVVTGEDVLLESNQGTCRTFIDYGANRGRAARARAVALRCGGGSGDTPNGLRLSLSWDQSGKNVKGFGALPYTEMVRTRGECLRRDNRGLCLEWAWKTDEVTRWVSGPLTVIREQEG